MRLFLFGQIRDAAPHLNGSEVKADLRSLRELLAWLDENEADLSAALKRGGVRYAVDQHFADTSAALNPDSEVALMSPLSGG